MHFEHQTAGRIGPLPEAKKAGKPTAGTEGEDPAPVARTRPDVTQKGIAMIGNLRADALHQALVDMPVEDDTLLAMLIPAFGGSNVAVDSGSDVHGDDRKAICWSIPTRCFV